MPGLEQVIDIPHDIGGVARPHQGESGFSGAITGKQRFAAGRIGSAGVAGADIGISHGNIWQKPDNLLTQSQITDYPSPSFCK
jgi:hypothetical protein